MDSNVMDAVFNCKLCQAQHPIRGAGDQYHPCFVPAMMDTIGFMLLQIESRLDTIERKIASLEREKGPKFTLLDND